ncbi:NAD(P)-binding protein [Corynespora cassiicola Philippines]|uniref:NAD(P)-binding protein n=1 Tax=Corynespora cassiicola Philippines TaxID=1448308 RepID=A0A2T2N7T1_CORCC|nr:NAD(P)-binding protein [Corynespora cassiicola Philippines]
MGFSWNPAKEIPSLEGKTFLITGGNIGLGRQAALDLARHNPSQIWIAARNAQKADKTMTDIRAVAPRTDVRFLALDLASFASIKDAARHFLAEAQRLDVLMLNAGIMAVPAGLTKEGYEMHFGVNHVGHALLLRLLTPLLVKTATQLPGGSKDSVRVIMVASTAARTVPKGGIAFDTLKTTCESMFMGYRYGQSKLANIVYAQEVARRYPEFTTMSIHPGVVDTDLQTDAGGNWVIGAFQKLFIPFIKISVEEGAKSQLWAATAEGVVNGEYYEPVGVAGRGSALSKSRDLGEKLWWWTEDELAAHVG